MARRPFIAGNWKLHCTVQESLDLVDGLVSQLPNELPADVCVAPVFTALHAVGQRLGDKPIALAGQNVYDEDSGAYTGEVSPVMLKDVGCTHCIVGHSERRTLFGETDAEVRKKTASLLAHDLTPIVCIGETLAQREAGETLKVVLGQLDAGFEGLSPEQVAKCIVAYEPVWAIGTGRTAKPEDAQEVHAAIRTRLGEKWGSRVAEVVRILYGGSVKPANAEELLSRPDIDGALVGGASLAADTFVPIVQAAPR